MPLFFGCVAPVEHQLLIITCPRLLRTTPCCFLQSAFRSSCLRAKGSKAKSQPPKCYTLHPKRHYYDINRDRAGGKLLDSCKNLPTVESKRPFHQMLRYGKPTSSYPTWNHTASWCALASRCFLVCPRTTWQPWRNARISAPIRLQACSFSRMLYVGQRVCECFVYVLGGVLRRETTTSKWRLVVVSMSISIKNIAHEKSN